MNIDEIEIGKKYEDVLGKSTYSKKGNLMKERTRREVVVTNKTTNSIEYRDERGFISWVTLEDFIRVERAVNKMRFVKVD